METHKLENNLGNESFLAGTAALAMCQHNANIRKVLKKTLKGFRIKDYLILVSGNCQ